MDMITCGGLTPQSTAPTIIKLHEAALNLHLVWNREEQRISSASHLITCQRSRWRRSELSPRRLTTCNMLDHFTQRSRADLHHMGSYRKHWLYKNWLVIYTLLCFSGQHSNLISLGANLVQTSHLTRPIVGVLPAKSHLLLLWAWGMIFVAWSHCFSTTFKCQIPESTLTIITLIHANSFYELILLK